MHTITLCFQPEGIMVEDTFSTIVDVSSGKFEKTFTVEYPEKAVTSVGSRRITCEAIGNVVDSGRHNEHKLHNLYKEVHSYTAPFFSPTHSHRK